MSPAVVRQAGDPERDGDPERVEAERDDHGDELEGVGHEHASLRTRRPSVTKGTDASRGV
jgi:hypothetical protein